MQIESILKTVFVPVHRDGWPFVGLFAAAALGLALIAEPLGWIGAVLTLWCAYFFRDPDRVTPARDGLVISPADGVVQSVGTAVPPPELELGEASRTRIGVFMNVFNVHVNRVPTDGVVERAAHHPGAFLNASLDKASELNERMSVLMRSSGGHEIAFVQIAGLVARRIRCDLEPGQTVLAGERFGLIRFGSRVDVYLPDGIVPLVCQGQTVLAGETVLADLSPERLTNEPQREGVVR